MSSEATKRPWLAALLAVAITGLGHLYLRRWGRAFAWLLLVALTVFVFSPEGGPLEAELLDIAPIVLIAGMSVVDAYVIARKQNRDVAVQSEEQCPACGHTVAYDVEFCWYCAEPLTESSAEANDTES